MKKEKKYLKKRKNYCKSNVNTFMFDFVDTIRDFFSKKVKITLIIVFVSLILILCCTFAYKILFSGKQNNKETEHSQTQPQMATNNFSNTFSTSANIAPSMISQPTAEEIRNQNVRYDKLVEELAKSVVHIKGVYLKDTEDEDRYMLLNALGGEVFPAKKIKQQATCSGFFVSEDGYIVTNHHCVDDAQDIDVETKDGSKYSAKIIGYYEGADLAVLKISPLKGEKFPATKIGNSDELAVGDNIIVIGGPLGYKWSASAGIVSGKSRDVDYNNNDTSAKRHAWGTAGEYIQVDAAINGGNSGGPVFNLKGEVIGVASAGYTFLQGMKFIIASNTLKEYLPKLKKGRIISKGLWGISVNELEPYDVKAIGLSKNSGMLVPKVLKDSPAEKAGMKRGDVILSINGKEIKDKIAFRNVNHEIFAGSISTVVVNRYGKIKKFKIKADNVKNIEKLEKGEIGIQDWSDGNISYRLLTSKMHKKFHFPKYVSGIIVTEIKNNDDPMLMVAVGDIIMQVNDKEVSSIEDYQKIIKELKNNKKSMAMFHIYKPTRDMIYVKGSKIS